MVDDITRKRWEKAKDATETDPTTAVQVFLDDMQTGKIKPKQVCIVYTDEDENGDVAVSFYSAGPQTSLENQGMLFRAANALNP